MSHSATAATPVVHTLYGETMGTRWRVDLCTAPHAPLDPLHAAVQRRLDASVAQMSTWEPDSDISRFNRAPAGSALPLPGDFFRVMDAALQVARASGGAFDPAIGAVVAAWGFGARGQGSGRLPDATILASARQASGWRRLRLDRDARVLHQPGGLALDLSAIAKGHGVDAVVELLQNHGITAALVDVGGELRGFGHKPDGTPWRVLVETGDADGDEAPCVLVLDGVAVATSGPRWHRFEAGGRSFAHTIDPRRGAPVDDAPAAVSVIDPLAMRADAWSTALGAMGTGDGFDFALAHGLAARIVPAIAGAGIRMTPAFEARLAR